MDTPLRALFEVPWFGEATTDQADPLNRSISVRFAFVAAPTLPTAHHSLVDTKAASVSSPPDSDGPTRVKEPHVEAVARAVPAADTASRPGSVLAAVAAAPAAATPTTKLRRDTGAGLQPSCSRSCSAAFSPTAPPKNGHDPNP